MSAYKEYFEYLNKRSHLGFLYRKYWLYPRLSKLLVGKTLDVGCGVGDMLSFRPDTTGVDINPLTVEWCRSQGRDVFEMIEDVLPFASGSFQSVMLDNVIEHLYEPTALLSEIYRVLHPGGTLVVGVPGLRGYASDADHKTFYDKEKLVDVMNAAGFTMSRLMYLPFPFPGLSRYLRQYCLYGVFVRKS
jgi:SAM-dependent methyltransferase